MCGIFCSIRNFGQNSDKFQPKTIISESTRQLLEHRGPDACSSHHIQTSAFDIHFAGFLLWQQGSQPKVQPIISPNNLLLFNGDIFMDECKASDQNDSVWLAHEIDRCNSEHEFIELFKRLRGPYSIISYNRKTDVLYFVRDSLGRQTLLLGIDGNELVITSVAEKSGFYTEVPPLGVFKVAISNEQQIIYSLYPWQDLNSHSIYKQQLKELEKLLGHNVDILPSIDPLWLHTIDDHLATYNFETILANDNFVTSPSSLFDKLLENSDIRSACDTILEHLSNSVNERVAATPSHCKLCINVTDPIGHGTCHHSKVGILFSGGIDCTILAVLADKYIHPDDDIDLVNVSFEKVKRNAQPNAMGNEQNYCTPDRLSARESLKELQCLCPRRKWQLLEVNISRCVLKEALIDRISHLVSPLNSVLDESLGAALWFAASANGQITGNDSAPIAYTSPSRVLLIGSGADELFGGYTRHRNAFNRATELPWQQLADELHFDWVRLPTRNLARDDRAIGDHGITARSPYVHENLTAFVRELHPAQKCYYGLEPGVGDKLLLRLSGYRLGLQNVCSMKKRALQFGSRIADSKQNAKDVSTALGPVPN